MRSMILAIPGGRGLCSTLYTGFTQSDRHRIRLSRPLADAIEDFAYIAHDLGSCLTHLIEIVPDLPVALGAADACGNGMGGVWLSPDISFTPLLWRAEFPAAVQADLVSTENSAGTITNSDLELAGQLEHQDVLVHACDCRRCTVSLLTDNIPARNWHQKGSTTTLRPTAYLLHINSLHQRHDRYLSTVDYIPGPSNVMADDASHMWHLSKTDLLAYFNLIYPQPLPWKLSLLQPAVHSALTMALQRSRFRAGTVPARSRSRNATWLLWCDYCESLGIEPMLSALADPIPFLQVLPSAGAREQSPRAVNLSELAQWKMPSPSSVRRWPAWGPATSGLINKESSNTDSNNNSKGYKRADIPPSRVKPVPFYIIDHANHVARAAQALSPLLRQTWPLSPFLSCFVPVSTPNQQHSPIFNQLNLAPPN